MANRDRTRELVWASQGFDGGIVTSVPAHALDGDESPDAQNFDPSARYKLLKRRGYTSFTGTHGSPSGTRIRGLYGSTFQDGTAVFLAKEGTAVYDIAAGNWSTVLTGYDTLADGNNVHFTMYKNIVVMTNDTASAYRAQQWSGSGAWTDMPSGCDGRFPQVHKGRLFLASVGSEMSKVLYSAVNDITDWTSADNAGSFFVGAGDGMRINGIISDGDTMYVSKVHPGTREGALYAVFGDTPPQFTIRRIAWMGATSHRAMTLMKSMAVFASREGIYGVSGNRLLLLSNAITPDWKALTTAQQDECCVGRYQDQLWISYPTSSDNDTTWVYESIYQRWSKYNLAARVMVTHPNGGLYGAAPSSTIRVLKFNDGLTDLGSAIAMYWNTPDLDFGAWHLDKRWLGTALHLAVTARTWVMTHKIDGTDSGDSVNVAGQSTSDPVKYIKHLVTDPVGRFIRFKIAESSSSAAEAYGIMVSAEPFNDERGAY